MKAIETRYRGYRFRSRLEARWAVFFDSLQVRWEYEAQGVVLPSGPYLPDFWLPDLGVFGEVKPFDDAFNWPQAFELAEQSGRIVVALIGPPENDWFPAARPTIPYVTLKGEHDDIPASRDWFDWGASACEMTQWLWGGDDKPPAPYDAYNMQPAVNRARGARFEFGERP